MHSTNEADVPPENGKASPMYMYDQSQSHHGIGLVESDPIRKSDGLEVTQ